MAAASEDTAPEGTVYATDPDGKTVAIPTDAAQSAARQGYTPASDEAIKGLLYAKHYGTPGQMAKTAVEGALAMPTLGGSTALEVASGLATPEDIKGRETTNPVLHTGAGLVGTAAASLATMGADAEAVGGAGLAKTAAKFIPSNIIESLAGAGEKAAASVIGEGATSVAGRLAQKAAAKMIGGKIAGAGFGLGDVVHESALDPMTPEAAMAHIGLSALIGGGLGGLTGAVESAVPEAVAGARKAATKLRDTFVEEYPGLVGKVAGPEAEARAAALMANREQFRTPVDLEKGAKDLSRNMGDQLKAVDGLVKKTHAEVLPNELAELEASRSASPAAAYKPPETSPYVEAHSKLLADKDAYIREFGTLKTGEINPGKVRRFLAGGEDASNANKIAAYDNFQKSIENYTKEAEAASAKIPGRDFDSEALGELKDRTADSLATNRQAAAFQRTLAEGAQPPLSPAAAAGLGMLGNAHPALAATAGGVKALSVLASPVKTIRILSNLEAAAGLVDRHIDNAMGALVRGGVKGADVARGMVAAGIASHVGKSDAESSRLYDKNVAMINKMSDPTNLHDAVSKAIEPLNEHAPNTAVGMASSAANTISVLAMMIPKHTKGGPLSHAYTPPKSEKALVNHAVHLANKPLSFFSSVKAGTATAKDMSLMKAIHPQLMARAQQHLMTHLTKVRNVPYSARAGISMFLGQAMDGSFQPAAIRAAQATYAPTPPPQAPQGGAKPNPAAGKINLGDRFQTPAQASTAR